MSNNTANVGLWVVRDDFEGQLQSQLGTPHEPHVENPVEQLSNEPAFYLDKLSTFVEEHMVDSFEKLFQELPKYEPQLLGTFVINDDGEVLSHTSELQ